MSELDPKALDVAANVFSASRFSAKHLDAAEAIIRAYLEAAPPKGQAEAVALKPLEWISEPPYSVARVPSLYLLYSTECVWNEGKFEFCQLSGNCLNKVFPTLKDARAAAQADFEARIRSALASPAPTGRAVEVTEAMVERAYDAFTSSFNAKPIGCNNTRDDLRAALEAALLAPPASGAVEAETPDERWPEPGDKMKFLGRNGYDFELKKALETMAVGEVVTVADCKVGGWSTSISFEEYPGQWNSVMFELLPAAPREGR